jgi:hemerythrin-like domain-containing protein
MKDVKDKGNEQKDEAEAAIEKAPEYFEDMKNGVSKELNYLVKSLKNQYSEAEKIINDMFFNVIKPKTDFKEFLWTY